MEKEKILQLIATVIFLVSTFFFVQPVSALTASSENYSVSMFGTGMATADPSSTNYKAKSLSTSQSGTRNGESNSYTVNLGFFENTTYYRTVSITSYSISPRSAVVGSSISLSISALNAQSVWARIVAPNSQEQTTNLVNNQFIVYNPPSIVGRYNVTFYTNSSTGAIASVIDYFELTAQTTTPSGGGSSGGGGTTIIEKCTYNWDCTPWSVCSDGKQTRECKNTGTCTGNESKPIEEMQCSKALFDIALKLKNIELTENKKLRFDVDLTEKIGTGKIDVYIKYSIIDKNNEEIFSQVETKAVQGNLSYEKEIEEIKLTNGGYILRVDIFYGYEQKAFAEQKIKIANGKIESEESTSNIQKIIEFLNDYKMFIIIIIIITFGLRSLLIFRKDGYQKRFNVKEKTKRKYFVYSLLVLLLFSLLIITLKTNITGKIINKLSSYNGRSMLIFFVIISIIILLIVLRKKIALNYKKIIEFLLNKIKNPDKYAKNSIKGLINKKVYSESGHYLGKVIDIILGENRIESLKIKVDKKHKFKTKGIIIDYKQVKSVGEIIIIDGEVLKQLREKRDS
ncbi:MAG: PRC-barrel domain-containing protein [Nanoarchaeota archaeon]|mgnify:CR=1 FL=1